jgi:hypothetical protein
MNEIIHQIVLLRFSVAVLGQKGQAGWWDCRFLDQSGLETLDYNFPKAPLAAGYMALPANMGSRKWHGTTMQAFVLVCVFIPTSHYARHD